eukprot:2021292-Amphidinium_carterae.1
MVEEIVDIIIAVLWQVVSSTQWWRRSLTPSYPCLWQASPWFPTTLWWRRSLCHHCCAVTHLDHRWIITARLRNHFCLAALLSACAAALSASCRTLSSAIG